MLAQWVRELKLPQGAVCLNIGSSTKDFRTQSQPHIEECLIRPLEESGLRIVHCDMKMAEGVDEVGDVLDPTFQEKLQSYGASLLICSNLLEHLEDPREFARACGRLVAPRGYGIFTVPRSYPYHPDPIDTMLRPSPEELAALLPEWEPVKVQELVTATYLDDLKRSGEPLARLSKQIGRVLLPFYRPRQWRPTAHRLLWLFRRYRQSVALLRKPASSDTPQSKQVQAR